MMLVIVLAFINHWSYTAISLKLPKQSRTYFDRLHSVHM